MSPLASPRTRVRPPSQTLPLLLLLAQVGCTPSRTEQDPLEGWHPPPREEMKDPPSEQEPPFVDPYADRDLDGTPDTDDCAAEDATRYRLVDVWHDADADGRTVKDPETLCVGDLLDEGQEWASDEAAGFIARSNAFMFKQNWDLVEQGSVMFPHNWRGAGDA